jgi:polyhydroxybutyrate depolymerase
MDLQPGRHVFTLPVGAQERHYLAYLPFNWWAERDTLPVVLMLHGSGGTARWTLTETSWDHTAEAEKFLLILPEGSRVDFHQPPGFLHNPQVWNDGSPRGQLAHPAADDVAFLATVLDDVEHRFPVDRRRVYVTGFSNGAGMTFRLGADLSPRLTAIAPVAGLCPLPNPRPQKPLPTLYLIGTADPLIPLNGGDVVSPWSGQIEHRPPVADTLRRWARGLDCPEKPVQNSVEDGVRRAVYGPGREGVELLAYFIEGLGHHWPGGQGQLRPRLAGPPSHRIRANALIWDFFRKHGAE